MGFSRQEYWSGLPFPSPEDLPDLGIEPGSPALQANALTSEPPGYMRVHLKHKYEDSVCPTWFTAAGFPPQVSFTCFPLQANG